MERQTIDMERYPRREHFDYFRSMCNPWLGVTVNVDVTELMSHRAGKSLFLAVNFCVTRAANAVPELRRRILGDGIVEYDHCATSHTELLDNGTYTYCTLDTADRSFDEYVPYAKVCQQAARERGTLEEDENADSYLFISCVPWFSFTNVALPYVGGGESNPCITWGKIFPQEGKWYLPMNLTVHHALVDGIHIAAFFRQLDKELTDLCQ